MSMPGMGGFLYHTATQHFATSQGEKHNALNMQ